MLFEAQAREIRELLKRSHLTEEQMAHRAHLKTETLRKYLGGYQKAGEDKMITMRTLAQMEIDRLNAAAKKADGPAELHDEVITYAGKLLEMPAKKRELAKQFIDELHANSDRDRANIRRKASAIGKQAITQHHQQKQKASGSTERKAEPGNGDRRETSPSRPSEEAGQSKKNPES